MNNVDETQIRQLAIDGATDREICEIHGLNETGLQERFGAMLVEARAQRRMFLRKLQNAAAKKGSAGILSLLGKHELGQGRITSDGEVDEPEPGLEPKVG